MPGNLIQKVKTYPDSHLPKLFGADRYSAKRTVKLVNVF